MGLIDKVVAAVTPEPSDEERAEARAKARVAAGGNGWLAMVLDHHEQLEAAFAAVRDAGSPATRRAAQKSLSLLLTAHSIAEEAVLYPAMALADQKAHSGEAYVQQSAAKVQAAALEDLEPMSEAFLDKLEHLRAAVALHMYQEESTWFPRLREAGETEKQAQLSRRYQQEFERYMAS